MESINVEVVAMQESNEQLYEQLNSLRKRQQDGAKNYLPFSLLSIGVVLLGIGLATYGSNSAWGLLWMPGAFFIAIGLMANADALRNSRHNQKKIEVIEAILAERRQSGR